MNDIEKRLSVFLIGCCVAAVYALLAGNTVVEQIIVMVTLISILGALTFFPYFSIFSLEHEGGMG